MAKDSAHEFSDAEIRAFEREVAGVYGEASKTAYANLKRYLAQFEADDEKMRERLEDGEITKAQYRSWRSGKIAAGRRYRIVLKQCAETMTHANVAAAAAIEGRLPEVYAENYNYGTWQVESAVGWDTAYALQDASTVQRLLTDHDSYLPKPSVNVAKDMAWNRRLIANQITQGVLLGESIPKIAKRIQDVAGSNRAAAVRLARTSTTAAENAGRVDSYKRAKGLGINVQQEWVATLDGRTRKRHRQLDREKVEVGEKFSNGCRYPGDPEAPYAETANCRCTLVACCDGLDVLDGERFSRLPEGMTYEEWKAGKPAVNGAKPANRTISEFMEMPGTKRKLDVAGVSKTEARKRLSRQLEDYGIPSSGFRKMSAGDQQKVLDTALWSAREGAGPKGLHPIERSGEYAVDMSKVASKGYRSKVADAVGGDAADGVHASIRRILTHRGGTNGEDLYAIDLATGRTVTSCVNSSVGSAVVPPAKFGKKVAAAIGDGRHVALLHNHPKSGIPSAADLRAVGDKGCSLGIIAAHDGSIYVFRKVAEPDPFYNDIEKKYLRVQKMYGGDESKLLKAIEERFGFKIEHIE